MEISEVIKKIIAGHAICPAVMGGMLARDWIEQQLFMVDIDNDSADIPIITPEEVLEICKKYNLKPVFYYFTYSSTDNKPKFRVAFVTNEPITDSGIRKKIMQTLINVFPQSDNLCINADRVFLGTNKKAVTGNLDSRIDIGTILNLFDSIPKKGHNSKGTSTQWEIPKPLEEFKLPSFPVNCLPDSLKDYVISVAKSTETSVDMAAVSALTIVASAVQGKFQVKYKNNHCEPLNLYTLIIGKSGERKSPVIKIMSKIIYQYEKDENKRRKRNITRDTTQLKIWKNQILILEKKGKVKEVRELQMKYNELEEKRVREIRAIADDITPEALISIMAENGGVMTLISTEGGFFESLGRYAKIVIIDALLKMYSIDPIRIDRKGRPSEIIDKPFLTMLLSAQDDVLENLLDNDTFKLRGLTARILYSKPASKIGTRKNDTPEIPKEYEDNYNELILELLNIPYPKDELISLKFDEKAQTLLNDFFNWLEPQLIDNLDNTYGWCEKLVGTTSRIAGVLHCAEHRKNSGNIPISEMTMKRAIKIARYYLEHAKYVYSLMGANKTISEAKVILKKLKGRDQREYNKYQILRLDRGRFKKVANVLPAIDLLVEYGYLQRIPHPDPTGGRNRDDTYILNPLYFDK